MKPTGQHRAGHSTIRLGESMSLAWPAASTKKPECEHKWQGSKRGKRWRVGGDREGVDSLRAVDFNLFHFAAIQTLMQRSRRAACREVANNRLALPRCICHTLVLVTKGPHRVPAAMSHRLKATALEMEGTAKEQNSCMEKKEEDASEGRD